MLGGNLGRCSGRDFTAAGSGFFLIWRRLRLLEQFVRISEEGAELPLALRLVQKRHLFDIDAQLGARQRNEQQVEGWLCLVAAGEAEQLDIKRLKNGWSRLIPAAASLVKFHSGL